MGEKECGFILRRLGTSSTFSLLSSCKGKITVVIKHAKISYRLYPGMLIALNTSPAMLIYEGSEIEIVAMPQMMSDQDIVWVHHLLELFYYFTPSHIPQTEGFFQLSSYLTLLSYSSDIKEQMPLLKKMCIIDLLQTTGFYRYHLQDAAILFKKLISVCNQSRSEQELKKIGRALSLLDGCELKKLDKYIISCLQEHPSFKFFKTIPFVYSP